MDELDLIRTLRADEPATDANSRERVRNALQARISAPEPPQPPKRRRRFSLSWLIPVPLVAVVLVLAVVLIGGGSDSGEQEAAPAGQGTPAASATPTPAPTVISEGGGNDGDNASTTPSSGATVTATPAATPQATPSAAPRQPSSSASLPDTPAEAIEQLATNAAAQPAPFATGKYFYLAVGNRSFLSESWIDASGGGLLRGLRHGKVSYSQHTDDQHVDDQLTYSQAYALAADPKVIAAKAWTGGPPFATIDGILVLLGNVPLKPDQRAAAFRALGSVATKIDVKAPDQLVIEPSGSPDGRVTVTFDVAQSVIKKAQFSSGSDQTYAASGYVNSTDESVKSGLVTP